MENIQIQSNNNLQSLIGGFAEIPLPDLESFINGLNVLLIRKRVTDSNKRNKFLLPKINQTVLPEQAMERYIFLQDKMELENLLETEYQELLNLVAQEEKKRNKRFQYLLELAQLRDISLAQLMNQLGLNPIPNA
jgi:hypothetical protein